MGKIKVELEVATDKLDKIDIETKSLDVVIKARRDTTKSLTEDIRNLRLLVESGLIGINF